MPRKLTEEEKKAKREQRNKAQRERLKKDDALREKKNANCRESRARHLIEDPINFSAQESERYNRNQQKRRAENPGSRVREYEKSRGAIPYSEMTKPELRRVADNMPKIVDLYERYDKNKYYKKFYFIITFTQYEEIFKKLDRSAKSDMGIQIIKARSTPGYDVTVLDQEQYKQFRKKYKTTSEGLQLSEEASEESIQEESEEITQAEKSAKATKSSTNRKAIKETRPSKRRLTRAKGSTLATTQSTNKPRISRKRSRSSSELDSPGSSLSSFSAPLTPNREESSLAQRRSPRLSAAVLSTQSEQSKALRSGKRPRLTYTLREESSRSFSDEEVESTESVASPSIAQLRAAKSISGKQPRKALNQAFLKDKQKSSSSSSYSEHSSVSEDSESASAERDISLSSTFNLAAAKRPRVSGSNAVIAKARELEVVTHAPARHPLSTPSLVDRRTEENLNAENIDLSLPAGTLPSSELALSLDEQNDNQLVNFENLENEEIFEFNAFNLIFPVDDAGWAEARHAVQSALSNEIAAISPSPFVGRREDESLLDDNLCKDTMLIENPFEFLLTNPNQAVQEAPLPKPGPAITTDFESPFIDELPEALGEFNDWFSSEDESEESAQALAAYVGEECINAPEEQLAPSTTTELNSQAQPLAAPEINQCLALCEDLNLANPEPAATDAEVRSLPVVAREKSNQLTINQTHFNHLIEILKSAISRLDKYSAQAVWKKNPFVQAWCLGLSLNFGSAQAPDLQAASLQELDGLFKFFLSHKATYLAKEIWQNHSLFRRWFCGQAIEHNSRVVRLAPDERIFNFKCALASGIPEIIETLWKESALIRRWFKGKKPVNFGTLEQPDWRTPTFDELRLNLQAILKSRCPNLIHACWTAYSPLFKQWFFGFPVNLGTEESPDWKILTLQDLASNFQAVLASHCTAVVDEFWQEVNPVFQFQHWFMGETVNYGSQAEPDEQRISFATLVLHFRALLLSHQHALTEMLWNGKPLLRDWFASKEINVGSQENEQLETIPLPTLAAFFKHGLATASQQVITSFCLKTICKANPLFQNWFLGQSVNFSPEGQPPSPQQITTDELVSHFKKILSSHNLTLLKDWKTNQRLVDALKHLNKPAAILVLRRVMHCTRFDFIEDYLDFEEDKDVIRQVLHYVIEYCNNEEQVSEYMTQQMEALKARLAALNESAPRPLRQPRQKASREHFVTRALFTRLILNFQDALQAGNGAEVKNLWEKNPSLQQWFKSELVSIGSPDSFEYHLISLPELVNCFQLALTHQRGFLIKALWQGNPILRDWIGGQPINVGTQDAPQLERLSKMHVLEQFVKILQCARAPYLVKTLWENTPFIRDWCCQRPVNLGTEDNPHLTQADFETTYSLFKTALEHKDAFMIDSLWEANACLRDWFLGQPITLANNTTVPNVNACLYHFHLVLQSKSFKLAKLMWNEIAVLKDWYQGKAVEWGEEVQQPLTANKLLCVFNFFLKGGDSALLQALWENNAFLHQAIKGLSAQDLRVLEKKITQSNQDWLISAFSALKSGITHLTDTLPTCPTLAQAPLEASVQTLAARAEQYLQLGVTTLRAELDRGRAYHMPSSWHTDRFLKTWFIGKPVNFGTPAEPHYQSIDDHSLVINFESLLISQHGTLIKEMWKENKRLHQAILLLSQDRAALLLKRALFGRITSIQISYLHFENRIAVVEPLLLELVNKPSHTMNASDIFRKELLTYRLKVLQRGPWEEWARNMIGHSQTFSAAELQQLILMSLEPNPEHDYFFIERLVGEELIKLPALQKELGVALYPKGAVMYQLDISNRAQYQKKYHQLLNNDLGLSDEHLEASMALEDTAPVPSEEQLNALMEKFRALVVAKDISLSQLKEFWSQNPLLQDWFLGKDVNVGTETEKNLKAISSLDLLNNFKLALRCSFLMRAMWAQESQLQEAIRANDVFTSSALIAKTLSNKNSSESIKKLLNLETRPAAFMLAFFEMQKRATKQKTAATNIALLESKLKGLAFADYLAKADGLSNWSAEDQSFILSDHFVFIAADSAAPASISPLDRSALYQQLQQFEQALYSTVAKNGALVNSLWQDSPELRELLMGKAINLGSLERPQLIALAPEMLVFFFLKAGRHHYIKITELIWNNNQILQGYLQNLDGKTNFNLLTQLLDMCCIHTQVNSKVRDEYIQLETRIPVIQAVVAKQEKSTDKIKKQIIIPILERRLAVLSGTPLTPCVASGVRRSRTHLQSAPLSEQNQLSQTTPRPSNRSKRSPEFTLFQQCLKQLPPQAISGDFRVSQRFGNDLQSPLCASLRRELGITELLPVPGSDEWQVCLASPGIYQSKYNSLLVKYQLSADANNSARQTRPREALSLTPHDVWKQLPVQPVGNQFQISQALWSQLQSLLTPERRKELGITRTRKVTNKPLYNLFLSSGETFRQGLQQLLQPTTSSLPQQTALPSPATTVQTSPLNTTIDNNTPSDRSTTLNLPTPRINASIHSNHVPPANSVLAQHSLFNRPAIRVTEPIAEPASRYTDEEICLQYQYDSEDIEAILRNRIQERDELRYTAILTAASVHGVSVNKPSNVISAYLNSLSPDSRPHYALLPIQINNGHWVGLALNIQGNQVINAIFHDSLPHSLNAEPVLQDLLLSGVLQGRESFQVLQDRLIQPDSVSCGLFMIENFLYLLTKEKFTTQRGNLNRSIRECHLELLKRHRPDYYARFFPKQRDNQNTVGNFSTALAAHGLFNHTQGATSSLAMEDNTLEGLEELEEIDWEYSMFDF